MNKDLLLLKKYYGEKFSHFARDLFPSILEEEGLLFSIIDGHFAHNHSLYDDIIKSKSEEDFKDYIYSFVHKKEEKVKSDLSPQELLAKAGYDLYECHTEEDIQSFKKYYAKNEELCTFIGGRLNSCYVFFAVKKDVDRIRRSDFEKPERQDLYGSSVISIQFSRNNNYLSIKNRYNHMVTNPDATFSNNLDNIIPGLTDSFEKEYGFDICNKEEEIYIPGYVMPSDGKLYKFNYEIYNIYYCPNNIIIDNGKIIKDYSNKSRYIFIDYYIIDMSEKRIFCYDGGIDDSFRDNYEYFDKIEIVKENNIRNLIITRDNKEFKIGVDDLGRIISFEDNNLIEVEDGFLNRSTYIKSFKGANIYSIYNDFLRDAVLLEEIELPNVYSIGDDFLVTNENLEKISLPKLYKVGMRFLQNNLLLKDAKLPNLMITGADFLGRNIALDKIDFENLQVVGDAFIYCNSQLEEINLPNLKVVGNHFLANCSNAGQHLVFENLEQIASNFMNRNNSLISIDLPKVKKIGHDFMHSNTTIVRINLPEVEEIGNNFLSNNSSMISLYLPKVINIGSEFLDWNGMLEYFIAPNLKSVGNYFLHSNQNLVRLELPSLEKCNNYFMMSNIHLKTLVAPNLQYIGSRFCYANEDLEYIEISDNAFVSRDSFTSNTKGNKIIKGLRQTGVWENKNKRRIKTYGRT